MITKEKNEKYQVQLFLTLRHLQYEAAVAEKLLFIKRKDLILKLRKRVNFFIREVEQKVLDVINKD